MLNGSDGSSTGVSDAGRLIGAPVNQRTVNSADPDGIGRRPQWGWLRQICSHWVARAVVAVLGATAGAGLGLALGRLGDFVLLFGTPIDTRLAGIVVGAAIGSLAPVYPPPTTLGTIAHAAAAGVGVAGVMVIGIGRAYFVPWVLWRAVEFASAAGLILALSLRLASWVASLRARSSDDDVVA